MLAMVNITLVEQLLRQDLAAVAAVGMKATLEEKAEAGLY